MQNQITSFRGEYEFLSNFYCAAITYNGITFGSSEAAYQAMKCPDRAEEFINLPPAKAKKLGRSVPIRPDWEQVKDNIMYEICLAKFTQHGWLLKRLLSTGDAELIEGNDWGDKYWGVSEGEGQNKLGKILMRVRAELTPENG